jgi:hypothetical protein
LDIVINTYGIKYSAMVFDKLTQHVDIVSANTLDTISQGADIAGPFIFNRRRLRKPVSPRDSNINLEKFATMMLEES